jgi:ubiquinone/menaquinone biosynthesis C-methylase UbiE
MKEAATLEILRALADEIRLRIVKATLKEELSVAELVDVLGLPQSTVSRHLKPLRDARLVGTRREGTSVYYRQGPALGEPWLGGVLGGRLDELPSARRDAAALRRVIEARRTRSRVFFERMAGRYASLTQPGGGWEALAAALAAGFAGRHVADLGAGEGGLTMLLARFARRVTAVDQSRAMLDEVQARAKRQGVAARVRTVCGDLEKVPMGPGSVDAVFLSQALHHAARPPLAVREAARLLKRGGQLVILDLARHEEDWVRRKLADQWLGFDSEELTAWMKEAGVRPLVAERVGDLNSRLPVLMAVGVRK